MAGPWFAIFPYEYTSRPIWVRGILFRGSDDLSDLSPEVQTHLQTLFAMFYVYDDLGLRTDLRIKSMMYAYLPSADDQEANAQQFQRLREAHILLTYLHTSPHETMPALTSKPELFSLYTFTTWHVFRYAIWKPDQHERVEPDNAEGTCLAYSVHV